MSVASILLTPNRGFGEWETVGHPHTTNAGKDAHVRVRRVGQPSVSEIRTWSAHERIRREAGDH